MKSLHISEVPLVIKYAKSHQERIASSWGLFLCTINVFYLPPDRTTFEKKKI
jgi:hypothetical protein